MSTDQHLPPGPYCPSQTLEQPYPPLPAPGRFSIPMALTQSSVDLSTAHLLDTWGPAWGLPAPLPWLSRRWEGSFSTGVTQGGVDTAMVSSTSICQGLHIPFAGVLRMFTHSKVSVACSFSRLTLSVGTHVGHLCCAAGLPWPMSICYLTK